MEDQSPPPHICFLSALMRSRRFSSLKTFLWFLLLLLFLTGLTYGEPGVGEEWEVPRVETDVADRLWASYPVNQAEP
jgi:hypothetical protein